LRVLDIAQKRHTPFERIIAQENPRILRGEAVEGSCEINKKRTTGQETHPETQSTRKRSCVGSGMNEKYGSIDPLGTKSITGIHCLQTCCL
jgi:hypothetical protein